MLSKKIVTFKKIENAYIISGRYGHEISHEKTGIKGTDDDMYIIYNKIYKQTYKNLV